MNHFGTYRSRTWLDKNCPTLQDDQGCPVYKLGGWQLQCKKRWVRAACKRSCEPCDSNSSEATGSILSAAVTEPVVPHSHRCTSELVMMDSRNATTDELQRGVVALNYQYAERHNISFTYARPNPGPWLLAGSKPNWCKLKLLVDLMKNRLRTESSCHWIAFLDSDAFVREQHVHFLDLFPAVEDPDAEFVLSLDSINHKNEKVQQAQGLVAPAHVNTGVMFLKATYPMLSFMRAW
eukprot:CAMPEP_0119335422 /NCGR_PEP_ID=MMETSP1333-20130426/89582_1 /TAXON_ID=418940 /ORGANISM="Scyphosphaera apsteinii, Strain RCC1455" /LENGTH=235 /DNA_ID=CAMNT_0007345971 /DNA_START=68 /DNA_END=772 /DNA_ORIENTATION=-